MICMISLIWDPGALVLMPGGHRLDLLFGGLMGGAKLGGVYRRGMRMCRGHVGCAHVIQNGSRHSVRSTQEGHRDNTATLAHPPQPLHQPLSLFPCCCCSCWGSCLWSGLGCFQFFFGVAVAVLDSLCCSYLHCCHVPVCKPDMLRQVCECFD